jgi:HSP20 family protein
MALLVKPEPFSREVDRLFDAFFSPQAEPRRWVPPMDLVEAEDHFTLTVDLPGLADEDVAIEVQDGTLRITGERAASHEASEGGWYRIERAVGAFSRSLTLPDGIDADAISASFDRGVLTVQIPKPEERKPRRVTIGVGDAKPAVEGTAQES